MTKERPILFSGAMVRAILGGQKTMTRRALTRQPEADREIVAGPYYPTVIARNGEEMPGEPTYGAFTHDGDWAIKCPYGQPGDRLWVRESFWGCDGEGYGDTPCVVYDDEWHGKEYRAAEIRPWAPKFGRIPSIHMPRNCSRILLEITDVRVERLKQISQDDCLAEGIDTEGPDYNEGENYSNAGSPVSAERWAFSALWNSTGGDWEANPWVWVVEFKRIPI